MFMSEQQLHSSFFFRAGRRAMKVLLAISSVFFSSGLLAQEFFAAEPYGGTAGLKDLIRLEMVYPEQDMRKGMEGEVKLLVATKENGDVSSIEVTRSVTPAMDSEAVRILRKVLWKPARYNGNAVADSQTVTVPFNIKKYNRACADRGYTAIIYPYEPVDESGKVYSFKDVNELPRLLFKDQSMTLGAFINKEIQYPDAAVKFNIMGKETVWFVVEPNGIITNIQPENYVGAGCWEEAVRLVRMLKWYPGIKNGNAVRTSMTISITFNLSEGSGLHYVPTQLNNTVKQ
jgi:TonB family protein